MSGIKEDKCICEKIDINSRELLSRGCWCDLYLEKNEIGNYYIVGAGDGEATMYIRYCPMCGRDLDE